MVCCIKEKVHHTYFGEKKIGVQGTLLTQCLLKLFIMTSQKPCVNKDITIHYRLAANIAWSHILNEKRLKVNTMTYNASWWNVERSVKPIIQGILLQSIFHKDVVFDDVSSFEETLKCICSYIQILIFLVLLYSQLDPHSIKWKCR